MNKLMSGRWILTVATAGVFIYVAVTGELDAATTSCIILFVFREYFSQGAKKDENGNKPK
jgi:hypothetical protein